MKTTPPFLTFITFFAAGLLTLWGFSTYKAMAESLEHFYRLTAQDPLLYDSELDMARLSENLARMRKLETELTFKKFLPSDHLFELEPVKVATENFLKSKSFSAARKLLRTQQEFATAYRLEVKKHLTDLRGLMAGAGRSKDQKINFFNSATNPRIILHDLALILKNAEALEAEIAAREKCLSSGECDIKISNSEFLISEVSENISEDIELLPLEILAPEGYAAFRGPYTAKTGCFGFEENGSQKIQYFYIFEQEKNGKKVLFPKLATENYYSVLKDSRFPFTRHLLAKGIRYDQHMETNDYRCSDLTYWPELLAKDRIAQGGQPSPAKLWTLPYLLDNMPALDFMLYNSKISGTPDPFFLLTAANPYSILYLTFSPAVWRIEEKPRFLDGQNYPLNPAFATWSQLKSLGIDDEEFKKHFDRISALKEFATNYQPGRASELAADPVVQLWAWFEAVIKNYLRFWPHLPGFNKLNFRLQQ